MPVQRSSGTRPQGQVSSSPQVRGRRPNTSPGPQGTGSGEANQKTACSFHGRQTARLQKMAKCTPVSRGQGHPCGLSPGSTGKAPGLGLWLPDLVAEWGRVWGVKLPLQNQDEQLTVGPSCAMTSDIRGTVLRGLLQSLLSYFRNCYQDFGFITISCFFLWFSG